MCFVTFTDLLYAFLSLDEKWKGCFCNFPHDVPSLFGIPPVPGLPFNERLQTQQTTLNSFHKFIPNYVSHNSTAMCMLICNTITVD